MKGLPRHEHYKDSGVSWIEEIPFSWRTERAKWLFQRMERPIRPEDEVVTAFRNGQVTLRKNRREEGFTNALQEHGYQGIRKGDLVIHAMDAFAGAIGVSDSDGKSTPVYSACIPRGKYYVNNYYYAYLLRYMSQSGFIQALAKGIRERSTDFRFNDFANLWLPIPSREEQDKIVSFLDQKTVEIDEAIKKKQRLIELLQEQKAILISQAVTKGLNPNIPMRDSGVEWIGEVPEHWQIAKLVRLTTRIGDGLHGTPEYADESKYHFINGNNLSYGAIKITPSTRSVSEAEFRKYELALDDSTILMSINGTIGNVAFYRGESLVLGKSAAYINCDKSLARNFLFFFLQSSTAKEFFQLELTGTTIFNLSLTSIRNLLVTLPPLTEQLEVSSFLTVKMEEFDDLINRVHCEINLLRAYRTLLITNVVTGKIDVRKAANRLPYEPDKSELRGVGEETEAVKKPKN